MIEVSGLRKTFGAVCALNEISFKVDKGHIVGFLGANGAGKTTAMDILCGCIGADAGTARVAGFEISEDPIEVKRRIGYLPDEPPLHREMTILEYLRYVGKLHGLTSKKLRTRVEDMLERLELGDVAHRLIGQLSKGYKQRVGLAQALIHDPEVLILDEPTEGLDPNQILQIRQLIRSLKGLHTILFSSHILSEVESTCDQLIIIDRGRIVEQGSHQELVGRLESGHQYHLKVRHGASSLVEQLRLQPTLSDLRVLEDDSQSITFRTKDQNEDIDKVAKIVIDGGFGLKELALKSKKLEDVFFQLTR